MSGEYKNELREWECDRCHLRTSLRVGWVGVLVEITAFDSGRWSVNRDYCPACAVELGYMGSTRADVSRSRGEA